MEKQELTDIKREWLNEKLIALETWKKSHKFIIVKKDA